MQVPVHDMKDFSLGLGGEVSPNALEHGAKYCQTSELDGGFVRYRRRNNNTILLNTVGGDSAKKNHAITDENR